MNLKFRLEIEPTVLFKIYIFLLTYLAVPGLS